MSPAAREDGLFVYGTLRFPEVVHALLDRLPSRTPAVAPGWRVAALPGRVFPGLVEGTGSAPGFLLTGLQEREWETLVAFEDALYDLRRLQLTGDRQAWAFVWGDSSRVSSVDWDPEEFARRALRSYVEGCRAWRRRYDSAQAARAGSRPAGW